MHADCTRFTYVCSLECVGIQRVVGMHVHVYVCACTCVCAMRVCACVGVPAYVRECIYACLCPLLGVLEGTEPFRAL